MEEREERFYQQKGFYITLFTSVLIFVVVWVTKYQKQLFLPEDAQISFSIDLLMLFAIGLLFKAKHMRKILGGFILLFFLVYLILAVQFYKGYLISYLLLGATLMSVLYFLFFSKSMEIYLNRRKGS